MQPQFAKRSTQPLRPESYRAIARRLRRFADRIERAAEPKSPREQATLTRLIHALAQFARITATRHNRLWRQ